MVSLVMDDLSSYNLARPIGPMNPTLKWLQLIAASVAAAAVAGVVVAAAVAAVTLVALSIVYSHLAPNGQRPTSLDRDYHKSDQWLIPLISLMLAMLVGNRPVSMQSTVPSWVCAVFVESLRIPVVASQWAHTESVPAGMVNSFD